VELLTTKSSIMFPMCLSSSYFLRKLVTSFVDEKGTTNKRAPPLVS